MNVTVDDQLHDYFGAAVPATFPPCPGEPVTVAPANRNRPTFVAVMFSLAAVFLLVVSLSITPPAQPKNEPVYDPFGSATANGKALKGTVIAEDEAKR